MLPRADGGEAPESRRHGCGSDLVELEEDKKVRMGGGLVREVRSAICV